MSEAADATSESIDSAVLHELLDRVPDLLTVTSPEGRFVWVSPSWQQVLGWTFEELTTRPFLDFIHPADRERTQQEAAEIFTLGRPAVEFTNRYETSWGEYRWLEWNATLSRGGLILASARDVTERKRSALLEMERLRLMEMTEQLAGVGQWRVDLLENRVHWSPRVFQIYGLTPGPEGLPVSEGIEAYHPEDREMVSAAVGQAIERQEGFDFTARIVRPSGEVRHVEAHGVPELNLDGETVAILGIFRDITDSRQMEEAMRRSERMSSIGTMAAGVAHEINNPLSYLMGNLQLIEEEIAELPDVAAGQKEMLLEMIRDSISGSHRVRKIVDGMRAFSRVGRTERVVQDPTAAIRAAISMADHEVRMRARLELELTHSRMIDVDETQLVQVLVNLLVNAAQAIPQGNASGNLITLATREEGDELVITVSDSGPGIPPDVRERIFDPFFTTKPVGSGTGLGLSICHSIVTQSGGRIVVDPDATGGTFRIYLPAVEGDATPTDGPDDEDHGPHVTPRILIVDDETRVTTMVARALRRDWESVSCHSGREALDILEDDRGFDLILCDLMMPEVTGMDVLRQLESSAPELVERMIFMTGGTLTPQAAALVEKLGTEVMIKPLEIPDLRARLARRISEIQ